MGNVRLADQALVEYLCELVLDLVGRVLCLGGDCLVKIIRGEDFDAHRKLVRGRGDRVRVRKPPLVARPLPRAIPARTGFSWGLDWASTAGMVRCATPQCS